MKRIQLQLCYIWLCLPLIGASVYKKSRQSTLPADIPNTSKKVYVESGTITDIPDGSFDGFNVLFYLFLRFNEIRDFPNLADVKDTLIEINLSGNEISTVTSENLEGFEKLKEVSLDGNRLTEIPPVNVLAASLEWLYLSSNYITSINTAALNGTTKLQTLWLYSNDITFIPSLQGLGLAKLESLQLDSNDITSVEPGWCVEQMKLESVGFLYNPLTIMPDLTGCASSLRKFYFYGTLITVLPVTTMQQMTSATELYFKEMPLNSLENLTALSGPDALPALTSLTVQEMEVTEIPENILCGKPLLTEVAITNTPIDSTSTLTCCGALERLQLTQHMMIQTTLISNCSALTYLDMSDGELTTFPDIRNIIALEFINVTNNKIRAVAPESFRNCQNLRTLVLKENLLETSPDLTNCTALTYLDMSHGELTSFPDIRNNIALEFINVSDNKITTLEPENLPTSVALTAIHLENNLLTSLPDLSTLVTSLTNRLVNKLLHASGNSLAFWCEMSNCWNKPELRDLIVFDGNPCINYPKTHLTNITREMICIDKPGEIKLDKYRLHKDEISLTPLLTTRGRSKMDCMRMCSDEIDCFAVKVTTVGGAGRKKSCQLFQTVSSGHVVQETEVYMRKDLIG